MKEERIARSGKQKNAQKIFVTAKGLDLQIQHPEERLSKVCEDTTDEKRRESCNGIRRRCRPAQDFWMDAANGCLPGRPHRVSFRFFSRQPAAHCRPEKSRHGHAYADGL